MGAQGWSEGKRGSKVKKTQRDTNTHRNEGDVASEAAQGMSEVVARS